jgi:hypothetical protein
MDETVLQEILDELFSALETLETQNGAMLQFLKNQGLAKDDEFAALLRGAGKASNVRWRATRARVNHLLSPKAKKVEKEPSPSANETKKSENAPEQSSEEHKDLAEPEKGAEKTEPDSRTEEDEVAPNEAPDSNPKTEESSADQPAKAPNPPRRDVA